MTENASCFHTKKQCSLAFNFNVNFISYLILNLIFKIHGNGNMMYHKSQISLLLNTKALEQLDEYLLILCFVLINLCMLILVNCLI